MEWTWELTMKFKVLATAALLTGAGSAYSQSYTNPSDPSMPESWFIQGEYYGQFQDNGARLGAHVRAVVNSYRVHLRWVVCRVIRVGRWEAGITTGMILVPHPATFTNGSMSITGTNVTATLAIPGNVKTALNTDKVITGTLGGRAFRLTGWNGNRPPKGCLRLPELKCFSMGHKPVFLRIGVMREAGEYSPITGYLSRREQRFAARNIFLHIEILSAYMPTKEDQSRSNSGIYFQNRYEQQIMDSFGEQGLEKDSKGALYGSVSPFRNAALPPLVNWETYDIFMAASKTVPRKPRMPASSPG